MKILRSLDRRNSTIVSTGWFTTLTPKRWFAASRLSGDFSYPVSHSKGAPSPQTQKGPGHADSLNTAILSQSMNLSTHDHLRMRSVLIVLAAIAMTLFLLWWIMSSAPPNVY